MSSLKTSILIACALLLAASHAQANGDTDWSSLRFASLTTGDEGVKPIGGGAVAMAVQVLADSTGSEYLDAYEQGRTWDCVRMVLDAMLAQEIFASESPLGSHSGKSWSFWRDVAEVERVATKTHAPLGPDTSRVLREMETAFSELLEPDSASTHFFGGKQSGKSPGGQGN